MLDLIRLISTNDHFFSISGIRWCARALRRWLRRPVLAWTTRPMAGLLLLLLLSLRFRVFFFLFFSDDTKFSLFNGPLHPAAKWNQNWNTSSKWNSIESTLNTSYSQRHYLIQLASNRWHSKWCLVNIKKSPPPKKKRTRNQRRTTFFRRRWRRIREQRSSIVTCFVLCACSVHKEKVRTFSFFSFGFRLFFRNEQKTRDEKERVRQRKQTTSGIDKWRRLLFQSIERVMETNRELDGNCWKKISPASIRGPSKTNDRNPLNEKDPPKNKKKDNPGEIAGENVPRNTSTSAR